MTTDNGLFRFKIIVFHFSKKQVLIKIKINDFENQITSKPISYDFLHLWRYHVQSLTASSSVVNCRL